MRRVRGKRGDKGKPRWTAYLLWSTRKRRDVVVDHPDWSFAQIAKWISEEWKLIDADEKDELQKEAEEMNELGIRKLPRDDDAPDPDKVCLISGCSTERRFIFLLLSRTRQTRTVTSRRATGGSRSP